VDTIRRLLARFQGMDRRILYALLLVCVVIPFYVNWPPVHVRVSRQVRDAYKVIDAIPPHGNPLLLSIDYDPGSAAELTPMQVAVLRHCFSKGIRVLVVSMQITGQGAGIVAEVLPRIAAEYHKEKNVDWAFLGFQPNAAIGILQMGESFRRAFPVDYYGTPIDQIPLMESIQNYDQIPCVLTLAGTAVAEAWVIYAGARYGLKVIMGVTAVNMADYEPYYQSGQAKGILGGLKGAAEYETIIGQPADGMNGMRSQKVAHYLLIGFIALGNIAFWMNKRGGGR
jgi:hypothetical protein